MGNAVRARVGCLVYPHKFGPYFNFNFGLLPSEGREQNNEPREPSSIAEKSIRILREVEIYSSQGQTIQGDSA